MKIKKAKLEGAYRGVSAFFFCSSFLIFLLALSHSFLCYSLSHSFFTPLSYSFLCYSLSHSFFTPLSYSFLCYSLSHSFFTPLSYSFLCSPKKRIKERRHGGNPLLPFQSVFPRDPHPIRCGKFYV
jgi:hypothetical protein